MLDVQGGPDIDAGGQKLLDVLPALGMARAVRIGVGVFVDQQQSRAALQRGVQIEFQQGAVAVGEGLAGEGLKILGQGLGLAAAVGLDHADDHVHALGLAAGGGGQHGVGLAHAGGHAQEHA